MTTKTRSEIAKELDGCFCDDVHFNEPTCKKCIDNYKLLEKIDRKQYVDPKTDQLIQKE